MRAWHAESSADTLVELISSRLTGYDSYRCPLGRCCRPLRLVMRGQCRACVCVRERACVEVHVNKGVRVDACVASGVRMVFVHVRTCWYVLRRVMVWSVCRSGVGTMISRP